MSRSQAPPPDPIFFLDENMGNKIVRGILVKAGFRVEVHSDHFAQGTPDFEWLPEVGKRGWILITQDKMIRRHKNEVRALHAAKVCAFVISSKGLRGQEIGELIVQVIEKILSLTRTNPPPIVGVITKDRVVQLRDLDL